MSNTRQHQGAGSNEAPHGPWHSAEKSWEGNMAHFASVIAKEIQMEISFDEIAMMFGTEEQRNAFAMSMAAEPGVCIFNMATDAVHTVPLDTDYQVSYVFAEREGKPYRVELMHINQGFSPLHTAMSYSIEGRPIVVHLSWKCPDLAAYYKTTVLLRDAGLLNAQSCGSKYGRFSYWKHPLLWASKAALYVKPRINLRDSS